jgi:hypothetical protein
MKGADGFGCWCEVREKEGDATFDRKGCYGEVAASACFAVLEYMFAVPWPCKFDGRWRLEDGFLPKALTVGQVGRIQT